MHFCSVVQFVLTYTAAVWLGGGGGGGVGGGGGRRGIELV